MKITYIRDHKNPEEISTVDQIIFNLLYSDNNTGCDMGDGEYKIISATEKESEEAGRALYDLWEYLKAKGDTEGVKLASEVESGHIGELIAQRTFAYELGFKTALKLMQEMNQRDIALSVSNV